jgi:LuxR family transcriptional regulator, maltose regulon positive regulatory protein
MTRPMLATKFHVPTPRKGLIGRRRLAERLNRGVEAKLTLVSAPAGFGKTTLLSAWLASGLDRQMSAAWLSLDQTDDHARSFWTYVIAALQRVIPDVGAEAVTLLQSAEPSIELVLAVLVNDLTALSKEVVLVLDDYHLIDAREIHAGMGFLLEHLPAQVHLVIASRADPAFPLARLCARGDLVEVRAPICGSRPKRPRRISTRPWASV